MGSTADDCGDVALGRELFKSANHRAAGNSKLMREIPRRRQALPARQSTVQDRRAQFLVEPALDADMRRPYWKRQGLVFGVSRHRCSANWPNAINENGPFLPSILDRDWAPSHGVVGCGSAVRRGPVKSGV